MSISYSSATHEDQLKSEQQITSLQMCTLYWRSDALNNEEIHDNNENKDAVITQILYE